jgi:O-antigen/teichoic acid export membrane protein
MITMQGSIESNSIEETASELGARTANMAASLIVAKFLSFLVLGVSFIVIARLLQPTVYGYYTLAIAVSGFFGSFADFGIGIALTKFISEYKAKKNTGAIASVLSDGFTVLVIGGLVFTLLSIAFSWWTAQNVMHNISFAYLIQVASLTIVLSMLYGSSTSALIGFGKGKLVALSTASSMVVQSVASIALAVIGFGAFAPAFGLVLGYLFGFLLSLYLIRTEMRVLKTRIVKPTTDGIKKLLLFSTPLAFVNLLGSVTSNFATIFLGLFVVSAVIGNYGLASRVGGLIDVGIGSVATALLPAFSVTLSGSKSKTDTAHFYNVALHSAVVFLAPMIFFIAVMAKPIVYTVFGGTYTLAPLYIQIMSLGLLVGIAGAYTNMLLISGNLVKSVLKYNIIISAIQTALIFLLVPVLGGLGLAIVMLFVTQLLNTLIFVRKAVKAFNVKLWTGKIFRATVANIAAVSIIYPLRLALGGNYVFLLAISAILYVLIYPIILGILKGISHEDLERLVRITGKMPLFNRIVPLASQYTGIFIR